MRCCYPASERLQLGGRIHKNVARLEVLKNTKSQAAVGHRVDVVHLTWFYKNQRRHREKCHLHPWEAVFKKAVFTTGRKEFCVYCNFWSRRNEVSIPKMQFLATEDIKIIQREK